MTTIKVNGKQVRPSNAQLRESGVDPVAMRRIYSLKADIAHLLTRANKLGICMDISSYDQGGQLRGEAGGVTLDTNHDDHAAMKQTAFMHVQRLQVAGYDVGLYGNAEDVADETDTNLN